MAKKISGEVSEAEGLVSGEGVTGEEGEMSAGKKKEKEERQGLPKSGRIRIPRENQQDLEFTGRVLAEVEGYHGASVQVKKSRWTRLSVYQVEGKEHLYVCVVTHISFDRHPPVYFSKVFSTYEELIGFTGHTFLAKRLYRKLGLDADVETLN